MRPALAVLLTFSLGACVTESDPQPASPEPAVPALTTRAPEPEVSPTTTAASRITSATIAESESDDGTEAIVVTDKVTITVTDQ